MLYTVSSSIMAESLAEGGSPSGGACVIDNKTNTGWYISSFDQAKVPNKGWSIPHTKSRFIFIVDDLYRKR